MTRAEKHRESTRRKFMDQVMNLLSANLTLRQKASITILAFSEPLLSPYGPQSSSAEHPALALGGPFSVRLLRPIASRWIASRTAARGLQRGSLPTPYEPLVNEERPRPPPARSYGAWLKQPRKLHVPFLASV